MYVPGPSFLWVVTGHGHVVLYSQLYLHMAHVHEEKDCTKHPFDPFDPRACHRAQLSEKH